MNDSANRVYVRTLSNGLDVHRVKLVNGPLDGAESICSHDTVYQNGERYLRGTDDLYYHAPEETE